MSTEEEMSKLTYAVQHNPNCPMPFLVRLIAPGRGLLDLKPYVGRKAEDLTKDILGFGKTFTEASSAALEEKKAKATAHFLGPAEPAHSPDSTPAHEP